ncbi:hypothetical protein U0070_009455 [Myodes glareolus]|uniref:Uncharacterized protein n=1 Tax=Myodes glareolus TaxID=447135 RepID=A0AAW0HY47_MYOGA
MVFRALETRTLLSSGKQEFSSPFVVSRPASESIRKYGLLQGRSEKPSCSCCSLHLPQFSLASVRNLLGFGDKDAAFHQETRIQVSLYSFTTCFRVRQKIWPPSRVIREAFLFLLLSASPRVVFHICKERNVLLLLFLKNGILVSFFFFQAKELLQRGIPLPPPYIIISFLSPPPITVWEIQRLCLERIPGNLHLDLGSVIECSETSRAAATLALSLDPWASLMNPAYAVFGGIVSV